jgi:hypothetical protein
MHIYPMLSVGQSNTRIQSIRKEKERERKREEKRNTLAERGSGTGWQNGRGVTIDP